MDDMSRFSEQEKREHEAALRNMGDVVPREMFIAFLASWAIAHGEKPTEAEGALIHSWLVDYNITKGCVDAVMEGQMLCSGIADNGEPTFRLTDAGRRDAESTIREFGREASHGGE